MLSPSALPAQVSDQIQELRTEKETLEARIGAIDVRIQELVGQVSNNLVAYIASL